LAAATRSVSAAGQRCLFASCAWQAASRFCQLHDHALAALLDRLGDWPAAAAQVGALMFVARFAEEVDRRADALSA